jgi:hypothetical protein
MLAFFLGKNVSNNGLAQFLKCTFRKSYNIKNKYYGIKH